MTYADQLVNHLAAVLYAERQSPPRPHFQLSVTVGITDYALLLAIADLANDLRQALVWHFDAANLPADVTLTETELYPLLEDFQGRRHILDIFDADARTVKFQSPADDSLSHDQ